MPRTRPSMAAAALAGVLVVAAASYGLGRLATSGDDASTHADSGAVTLPSATSRAPSSAKSGGQTGQQAPIFHEEDVFYLGDGPRGPVLYPQSVLVIPGESRLDTGVNGLMEKPDLPQYRSWWKPGWITEASRRGDLVDVDVDGAPPGRPSDMDEQTAAQSVQQVVYTMQAASRSHDRVRFTRDGRPASSVLGVPTGRPLAAAPLARTESLVTIEEPELGGSILSRGPVPVSGLSNTAHGAIDVRLELNGKVVRTKLGHAAGSGDLGRLYPWKVVIDTSGLPNGHYLIVASGPDPTDPSLTATDRRPLRLAGHH